MENEIKCSLKKHSEEKAILFCKECNKYMCNKCNKLHADLFDDHNIIPMDKLNKNNFTGICKEENHNFELEYFCKTHNKLCCERCISKFKTKGRGKHSDCNIYPLEKIKDEKKIKLKVNIKILEDLNKNINIKIEELNNVIKKTEEEKEKLKEKIQKLFTQIRSVINEREDLLLLYVDKKYNKYFISKELHKEGIDLPKVIKKNLEKGNLIEKEWDNDKNNNDNNQLSLLINDCTNIENNIKKINEINNKLAKINKNDIKINFYPNDYEVNQLIQTLKNFGKVSHKEYKYAFKECPENMEENKKYLVSGYDNNILTKIGSNCWTGIMGKYPLEKNIIKHIWKIKILESHKNHNSIVIGLAPENFDINNSTYTNCGWYLCCCCGFLFSGEPHNYKGKKIEAKENKNKNNIYDLKNKTITLIMNMRTGCLMYANENQKAIEIYSNIPVDKKLYPVVFLKYKYDKVIVSDNNWQSFVYKKMEKKKKKEKEKEDLKINKNEDKKGEKKYDKKDEKKEKKNEEKEVKMPFYGRKGPIRGGRKGRGGY